MSIRTYDDYGEPIVASILKHFGYLFETAKEMYIENEKLSTETSLALCVDYIKATTEHDRGQSISEDDIYDLMVKYLKENK